MARFRDVSSTVKGVIQGIEVFYQYKEWKIAVWKSKAEVWIVAAIENGGKEWRTEALVSATEYACSLPDHKATKERWKDGEDPAPSTS